MSEKEMQLHKNLKACPFCGGDKVGFCETTYLPENSPAFAVSCRTWNCHGTIFSLGFGLFSTMEEAAAAWNQRESVE